jgi:hypothetical protein
VACGTNYDLWTGGVIRAWSGLCLARHVRDGDAIVDDLQLARGEVAVPQHRVLEVFGDQNGGVCEMVHGPSEDLVQNALLRMPPSGVDGSEDDWNSY